MLIVDSKLQAAKFGDISRALKAGIIPKDALMEVGEVLKLGIPENIKTIIVDFSGIGAQDVAMAEFVLSRLVPN
jgi:ornithine cyclodeaminase